MNTAYEDRLQSIITTLNAERHPRDNRSEKAAPISSGTRFVTISRQAGAGGKSLGSELAKAVNRRSPETENWSAWDKELVNKVAEDHHIQSKFIEALEDADHHWLNEFIADLSQADHPSDVKVYHRVATTIRALASAGNAIIVGRGGAFITSGLRGGINVRLVAPLGLRVRQMAERLQVPLADAAVKVHETDRNRSTFYHRYWPTRNVEPETFTVTFNTAELTESQMVACLLVLMVGDKVEVRL
jgi:cytidylate kinase